jgi:peptide/nickel transport system permease protein
VYALPVDAASALVDVGTWPHVLGTDPLGRDILVRLLRGLWWSLSLGLGGMGVGLGLGSGGGAGNGLFWGMGG